MGQTALDYGPLIRLIRQDLDDVVRRLDQGVSRYVDALAHGDETAETVGAGRPGEISPGEFSTLWRELLGRDGRLVDARHQHALTAEARPRLAAFAAERLGDVPRKDRRAKGELFARR
jgi:hypothetical protein